MQTLRKTRPTSPQQMGNPSQITRTKRKETLAVSCRQPQRPPAHRSVGLLGVRPVSPGSRPHTNTIDERRTNHVSSTPFRDVGTSRVVRTTQPAPPNLGGYVRTTPTISDAALVIIAVFVVIAVFHGWG